MSSAADTLEARAPKRARGHARVSAILDAAAAIFAEKGYDAATMTEIAARSSTAIGSLYRFFPTKVALADALLLRFGEGLTTRLAAIEARAADLTPLELADALVAMILERRVASTASLALVDARPEAAGHRMRIRATARTGIATILRRRAPALGAAAAGDAAIVVLQMLKGARALEEEDVRLLAGLRTAVALYLAHVLEVSP